MIISYIRYLASITLIPRKQSCIKGRISQHYKGKPGPSFRTRQRVFLASLGLCWWTARVERNKEWGPGRAQYTRNCTCSRHREEWQTFCIVWRSVGRYREWGAVGSRRGGWGCWPPGPSGAGPQCTCWRRWSESSAWRRRLSLVVVLTFSRLLFCLFSSDLNREELNKESVHWRDVTWVNENQTGSSD